MKKILLFTIFVWSIIACNPGTETKYYTVSEYPSTAYGSKKTAEIHETSYYESDSLAVAEEERKYHFIQDDWNRKVEEAKTKNSQSDVLIFTRFRDEQRCLIKITHNRSFDFESLKKLIIQHGPNSADVDAYCNNNDIELSIFPMLSNY